MIYRKTDVYKTVVNSKARSDLVTNATKMTRNGKMSGKLKSTVFELLGVMAKCPFHMKTLAAGALLYLVAPLDMVPDFIPIMGLADDMFVLGTVLMKIKQSIQ